MKTTLVIPDLQIPLEDGRFVDKLLAVAEYVQPDVLAFAGDLTDSTEVGQWVKGKPGEYTGKLQSAFDRTENIVRSFREAVGGECEMLLVDSNHDKRMRDYVSNYAPGLSGLRGVDFETSIGLDVHRVSLVQGPYWIGASTVLVHGHERTGSSVPGKWGLDRVSDYDANVVYGHTHTPGLFTTAVGTGHTLRTRWAMNVGHGMDRSKADYLTDGYSTWNQAFGLVHHDLIQGVDYAELVVAENMNGRFVFDGKMW